MLSRRSVLAGAAGLAWLAAGQGAQAQAPREIRIDFATLPDANADTTAERPSKPPANRRLRQQELMRHPLVRKAAELFDTEIIAVLDAPPSDESQSTETAADSRTLNPET